MLCPKCGRSTRVVKTMQGEDFSVRRVRWCARCEITFRTSEKAISEAFAAYHKRAGKAKEGGRAA